MLFRENLGTGYELGEQALSESRDGWFAKAGFFAAAPEVPPRGRHFELLPLLRFVT